MLPLPKTELPFVKKDEDIRRYKKQRSLIVIMNKNAKREYYESISPKSIDNDRKCWKVVKPMFSNVNPMSDKIIIIEDEKVITDDTDIAESFNTYFLNMTDSPGLSASEDILTKDLDTMITNAVESTRITQASRQLKPHCHKQIGLNFRKSTLGT